MGLDLIYLDGQTPIDEEEKVGLKIKSVTTQGTLNELEQLNIEKAVEWIIRSNFKTEVIFTEKFVRDVHRKMFEDVWKWAGNFRMTDKNIGTSWIKVPTDLRTLLDDAKYWIENDTYSPEEIAIRFKHRIVSIHCFPNGNGRHSRLMADIIMESVFAGGAFLWHRSNMAEPNETRKKYIRTLKIADQGNISPLIEFAMH